MTPPSVRGCGVGILLRSNTAGDGFPLESLAMLKSGDGRGVPTVPGVPHRLIDAESRPGIGARNDDVVVLLDRPRPEAIRLTVDHRVTQAHDEDVVAVHRARVDVAVERDGDARPGVEAVELVEQ